MFFFNFFKSHFLLKNNWSLISVITACFLLLSSSSAEGQQPPEVGWGLSAEESEVKRRVQTALVPLPWPLRGIRSSLQGVWQACSPINCACSSPHVERKHHHHPLLPCIVPLAAAEWWFQPPSASLTNRETFFQFLPACVRLSYHRTISSSPPLTCLLLQSPAFLTTCQNNLNCK